MCAAVFNQSTLNYESMYSNSDWLNTPHSTGTTIMAVEFKDGVIMGADSRTSTGVYVVNRISDKITKITDYIYCGRSGSAGDTQAISEIVSYHINFHSLELGEEPLVESTAALFRELCYNYRDSLTAGIIVAGWDKVKGGQIYSIPIGGMCIRQPVGLGGSGSSYIYGYVDSNFKPNMEKEEAVNFVVKAISSAILRDGSSGGVIRIGIITKDGCERRLFSGNDLPKPYDG